MTLTTKKLKPANKVRRGKVAAVAALMTLIVAAAFYLDTAILRTGHTYQSD